MSDDVTTDQLSDSSWDSVDLDAFPTQGDVVLGVRGGTMVRMPISGIGDTLATGSGNSQITKALAALAAAIEAAKLDFNNIFEQARLVQDTLNLSSGQALGTSDILGAVAGGGIPSRNQFSEFFGAIESGNLRNATARAGAAAIAGIEELKVASANLSDALAGTKQILAAAIGVNAAAIQNEQLARVNADGALSASLGTLTATIGGSFSTVNTVSAAVAQINGTLGATYSVTLDLNGYVSGIQLIAGADPAGSFSEFNIRADALNMVMPGFSAVPVMTIANVNGTPTLSFNGKIISDGSVLNRTVAPENICAIRGTNFSSSSAGSGLSFIGSGIVLTTWTFSVPQSASGPCAINISAPGFSTDFGGGSLAVKLDGTEIGRFTYPGYVSGDPAAPPVPVLMSYSTSLSAGNHTVQMVTATNNTFVTLSAGTISLVVGSK